MFCRKKIFKDSKESPESAKGGMNSNKNCDELRDNNEVSIHQSHLRAFQIFKQSKS